MTGTGRALKIISENDVYSPRKFAELFWPNHEGWKRHGRIGHGTTHGVGMMLAGGGFLGKLQRQGFIKVWLEHDYGGRHYSRSYYLTDKGRERLKQELSE